MSIGEAIEALEEDTTRDLGGLTKRIAALEARLKSPALDEAGSEISGEASKAAARTDPEKAATGSAANEQDDIIFRRMLTAMSDSKFTWRTVERLAILAGVTEREAHEILAAHQGREIRLGKAKSGKTIARLADR